MHLAPPDTPMATECAVFSLPAYAPLSQASGPFSYTIETISQIEQAEALASEWESLAADRVFLAPQWLLTWWRHYQTRQMQLWLVTVRDDRANLIGLAPWFCRRTLRGGREIRFLGSGEVCSDYLSLLVDPAHEQTVPEVLARYIANRRPVTDRILLEGVARDDWRMVKFAACLKAEFDYRTHAMPALGSYRIDLPKTWDEYVAQLSRSRRQRVRQMWRNQLDSGQGQVCVATDAASLDRGMSILIDLHQQRQNQLGHPGCFASQRFANFLREAAEHLQGSGHLRLQWIEMDGEPVAAELDFRSGNVQMHYCSGIAVNASFPRPGWLGITAAIRHAIEEGRESFDFLRGDEGYKSHWRGEPVEMVDWELIPPTYRAALRQWGRTAVQLLKGHAKRLLRRSAKPAQTDE